MTWFIITLTVVTSTLVAAALYAMPSLVHETLPVGVSVPAAHAHHRVVKAAVRRYRSYVVIAWLAAVASSIGFALTAPDVGISVPPLVMLAVGGGAYVVQRRAIIAAKRKEGWYEGVPVRLAADVTPATPAYPRQLLVLSGAGLAIFVVVAAIGAAMYPSMPSTLATHWNMSGDADEFSRKSIGVAFSPLIVSFLVNALLFAVSLVSSLRVRLAASDTPEQAAAFLRASTAPDELRTT